MERFTVLCYFFFLGINPTKKTDSLDQYSNNGGVNDGNVSLSKQHYKKQVVCYVAKLRDFPGKLLPKVAVSLGVPKGPMFRQLKDGHCVTLPDGKVVSDFSQSAKVK